MLLNLLLNDVDHLSYERALLLRGSLLLNLLLHIQDSILDLILRLLLYFFGHLHCHLKRLTWCPLLDRLVRDGDKDHLLFGNYLSCVSTGVNLLVQILVYLFMHLLLGLTKLFLILIDFAKWRMVERSGSRQGIMV